MGWQCSGPAAPPQAAGHSLLQAINEMGQLFLFNSSSTAHDLLMSGQFQSSQPRNHPNEPSQKAVKGSMGYWHKLQPCYSARCENKITMLDKLGLFCLCNTFPWALWMAQEQHQTPFTPAHNTKWFFPSWDKIETGLTLYQHMECAFGNCSDACISSSGMKISTAKSSSSGTVAPSAVCCTSHTAFPRYLRMDV